MKTEKTLQENYKKYQSRIDYFKACGYDIVAERNFIIEKAKPILGKLIDLGTGKGHFAIALAEQGYELTTVDISEEEQSYAKINARYFDLEKKITFVIDDAKKLSFSDNSFDMCFSVNLMHHLAEPLKVINEILRITKDGGKIVLSDFNSKGFKIIEEIHKAEGHHHPACLFTIDEIASYLTGAKVSIEKFSSSCQEMLLVQKWK